MLRQHVAYKGTNCRLPKVPSKYLSAESTKQRQITGWLTILEADNRTRTIEYGLCSVECYVQFACTFYTQTIINWSSIVSVRTNCLSPCPIIWSKRRDISSFIGSYLYIMALHTRIYFTLKGDYLKHLESNHRALDVRSEMTWRNPNLHSFHKSVNHGRRTLVSNAWLPAIWHWHEENK